MSGDTVTLCPCGCGREARTKQGWAARGCALRAIPREVRAARAKAYIQAHPDKFREAGRKGRAVWRKREWDDLIDRWLDDDVRPADALRQAWRRGYGAGFTAGQRSREQAR